MAKRESWRAAILPRQGVYAVGFEGMGKLPGFEGPDLRRFARLFAGTLRRIPLAPRRRILAHWRSGPSAQPSIRVVPTPFVPGWVFAQVTADGHWLKFGDLVRRMPDNVVEDLIAHELGHVEQYALGLWVPYNSTKPRRRKAFRDRLEVDADVRMRAWGFDSTTIFLWADADGIPEFAGVPKDDRYLRR